MSQSGEELGPELVARQAFLPPDLSADQLRGLQAHISGLGGSLGPVVIGAELEVAHFTPTKSDERLGREIVKFAHGDYSGGVYEGPEGSFFGRSQRPSVKTGIFDVRREAEDALLEELKLTETPLAFRFENTGSEFRQDFMVSSVRVADLIVKGLNPEMIETFLSTWGLSANEYRGDIARAIGALEVMAGLEPTVEEDDNQYVAISKLRDFAKNPDNDFTHAQPKAYFDKIKDRIVPQIERLRSLRALEPVAVRGNVTITGLTTRTFNEVAVSSLEVLAAGTGANTKNRKFMEAFLETVQS